MTMLFSGSIPYLTPVSGSGKVVDRRHPEYAKKAQRWHFLLDSWEGGEEYRHAIYGHRGGHPIKNLHRHKREANDKGGSDEDYQMRLQRTPVPSFVKEAVETHLADIYAQEIRREVPAACQDWMEDVDGCGTELNDWMHQAVGPLLLVLGQLDIVMGHPTPPPGATINTRADELTAGMDAIVASYVMPMLVLWWTLDSQGRYREVLIQEPNDLSPNDFRFRHWHEQGWDLYDKQGNHVTGDVYPYGRPPILRLFFRKSPRYRNIGMSLYEEIAEHAKEYYNRDSELILSDTLQAFPLLQGPEDYLTPDGTIPIGPSWLLPKKKNTRGGDATYEGFEVIEFPKEGAASIRENKRDIRDSVDRAAALVKPAGAAGTTGQTVAQSGISKRLDLKPGERILQTIASSLEKAERQMFAMLMMILGKPGVKVVKRARVAAVPQPQPQPQPILLPATQPPPTPLAQPLPATELQTAEELEIEVVYPREYDLFGPDEFAVLISDFQANLGAAGMAPTIEADALKAQVRMILRGKPDEVYRAYDREIDEVVARLAKEREQANELVFVSKTRAGDVATAVGPGGGGSQAALKAPATVPTPP